MSEEYTETDYINGADHLSCKFSLSHASFLTIPRVLMEAMPDEWQERMATLWDEYGDAFPNQPDISSRVQITCDGKLIKTPHWLVNYRHPDLFDIQRLKPRTVCDQSCWEWDECEQMQKRKSCTQTWAEGFRPQGKD